MRLFYKHIRRSICRAPWQPLLILLTLTLAVALAETAFCISGAFWRQEGKKAAVEADMGDLRITARAGGSSRLLFEAPAQEILGEDGKVLGEFSLSGFCERDGMHHTLEIAALDLERADEFYRFSYITYGEFHTQNIKNAAILSSETAQELGLAVGDRFTVRILENTLTLEVQAIAEESGLLAQRDMLISLDGVMQMLAERMPLIASLGDGFAPCTRLWIKLGEGVEAEAVRARLAADPLFAESYIAVASESEQFGFLLVLQLCFVLLFLMLLLLLAGFLICGSLELLHSARADQYRLFAQAGASPAQLRALLYAESLLYALFGGALGAWLAVATVRGAGSFYYWQKAPLAPGWQGTLFGLCFAPILMLICSMLYLRRHPLGGQLKGERTPSKQKKTPQYLLAGALLCLSLLLVFLPVRYRAVPAALAVLVLTLFLFAVTPALLCLAARGATQFILRAKRPCGGLLLALKNLQNNAALHHMCRMLCAFLALLCTLGFCAHSLSAQIATVTSKLPCELLASNATKETAALVRRDPDVAGCARASYLSDVSLPNNTSAIGISLSGDAALCIPAEFLPEQLPTGREILLSKGIAAKAEKKVGEEIQIEIDGTSHSFTVTGILPISTNFCYFDATQIGIEPDMLLVRLREGADAISATERLTAQLESQGAITLPPQMAFGTLPLSMEGHSRLAYCGVVAAALLGTLGCVNLFVQQYNSRRRERRILCECGMPRRRIAAMLTAEGTLLFLLAALLAVAGATALCLVINAGMHAFGLSLL